MSGKKMIIIRLSSYRQLFLLPVSLLLGIFLLFSPADAPNFYNSQDGAPLIIYGNESGSAGSLDALDGATWNLTADDIELGLKTVEFFIGQDNSTGISLGTTKTWPASIYLPEDNITVDSAIIEISMLPGATDISAGSVNIDGLNSTAIPRIQTTVPPLRMLYRYNATEPLGNFTKGTNSFTLNVAITGATGPIIYQENAKLILTYRYNRNSEVQLRTVRFFAGSDGTAKAVAADTSSTFKLNLPEISPQVKSAWIENAANIPSGGTTSSTYLLTINNNYHLSGLTHTNVGGARDILVLYNATPFYTLTNGWSAPYTLRMRSVAGYILNLWGAEAVLTYTYNATATMGNVTQKTVTYFAGANTTLITAGSRTNFTFNVDIPEDNPRVESVYFRITSDTAAADNTFTVNVNGSYAQNFLYDWIGETNGITPILMNGTGNLASRMRQGDNNLTLSIKNVGVGGVASALSAEAIVTYNYSASSRTQQESVQYLAYQSFREADTANVPKSGNWSVKMPATSINVTSAYLQTDPTISNTQTSLSGATSTGYGTWVNGSGSSFLVGTTDENLNVRTLLNATKVYGQEAIMAGKDSSWGVTLQVVSETNWAHSAKFILTYAFDRMSKVEVWHNSTAVSYTDSLSSVNATVRFMSQTTSWWNLTMYNWAQAKWIGCNSTWAYANAWNRWYCNMTADTFTTTDFISTENTIRIGMNSTNLTLTEKILEDYVAFGLTTVVPSISIALTNNLTGGILFRSVDPGARNVNASGNFNFTTGGSDNYETMYWVYTGPGSNNADFCIRDNESLRTGPDASPAYVIGNSNYTYSNATSGSNSATNPAPYGTNNMTATLQNSLGIRFATNMATGAPAFLRFFLNVSVGQPPGTYSNAVIFQAVATGSSVTCGGT